MARALLKKHDDDQAKKERSKSSLRSAIAKKEHSKLERLDVVGKWTRLELAVLA